MTIAPPARPPAPLSPPDDQAPFEVDLPAFRGGLGELAAALRAGRVAPRDVPLLDLARRVLARAETLRAARPDTAAELLPPLAAVIALKARLLLPPPDPDPEPDPDDDGDPDLDPVLEGVGLLAQLDEIVDFLGARHRARAGLIPARALDLGLPRRERKRGSGSLTKLLQAARSAVREVSVPLLARERTTLSAALGALRAYAARLRRFMFGGVTVQDWAERTTYFAALLEGIKTGDFEADQPEMYGDIEVRWLGKEAPEGEATEGAPVP